MLMNVKTCVNCISVSDARRSRRDNKKTTALNTDKKQDDAVARVDDDDDEEEKIPDWIRCSPADLYFKRDSVLNEY